MREPWYTNKGRAERRAEEPAPSAPAVTEANADEGVPEATEPTGAADAVVEHEGGEG